VAFAALVTQRIRKEECSFLKKKNQKTFAPVAVRPGAAARHLAKT
jgi:hypothetical protein